MCALILRSLLSNARLLCQNLRPTPDATRIRDSSRGRSNVPPELLADPRLNSTAKILIAALVENFAWTKDHCWPSDATIARIISKSVGHTQRCLRLLEYTGWIRREATNEVPNGRRIWFCWRLNSSAGAQHTHSPAPAPPQRRRSETPIVVVNPPTETNFVPDSQRRRPEPQVDLHAQSSAPPPTTPPEESSQSNEGAITPTTFSILASLLAPSTHLERFVNPLHDPRKPISSAIPPCTPVAKPPNEPQPSQPFPASKKPKIEAPNPPEHLAMLTEAQHQRLTEMPEKRRQRVETLLATGDRICQGEALRLLAPPPETRPAPQSVAELLCRLREDPVYPSQAAEALAQTLDDRRSWGTYHAVCQRAWAGHIPCSALVQAFREATNGRARNPGALFMSVLKREAPDWQSGPKPL